MIFKLELCKNEPKPHKGIKQFYWWRVRRGQKILTSETYTRSNSARRQLVIFGKYHGYLEYIDLTKGKPVSVGIPVMTQYERLQIRMKQLEQKIRDMGGGVSPGIRDLMHMIRILRD
jgi:hypothetical protein